MILNILAKLVGLPADQIANLIPKKTGDRDTSLDGIEMPTALLDRLISEAKAAPMDSAAAKKWKESKDDPHQSVADAMGISVDDVKRLMAEGRLTEANTRPKDQDDLAAIVKAQVQSPPVQPREAEVPPVQEKPRSRWSNIADMAQTGLDAVGVADPTPIADGVNAVWSIGRAFTDPERRKEHLQNAAISAVSMVPYVGDTAKLLKARRYAATASRALRSGQRAAYREAAGDVFSDGDGNGGPPVPPTPPSVGRPGEEERGKQEAESFAEKLKDAATKVAEFTGPIGKAGVAIYGFIQGLELLNTGILALNRDLAPYNGQLAAAYARFEVDELQRNVRKGDAMAGPLSKLAEEQSQLKDSMDKITNPIQAGIVQMLAVGTGAVNRILDLTRVVEPIANYAAWWWSWWGNQDEPTDPAAAQFFRDVSDGKFDGKAPMFGGGRRNLFPTEQERRDIFGP
ncbi:MAG: hypothetical protein ACO1RT_17590 [Planctomycetaceae bacterium]